MRPRVLERHLDIARLHKSGVRIAVGTDGGVIGNMHGPSFHTELELLAEAGLSPMDVIIAATRHGAEALGLQNEIGTVEPGKIADFLILNADPLAEVANLNRIGHVVVRGKMIDRQTLAR